MDKVHVRRIAPPERRKLQWMKRQLCNAVNSCHATIIFLSAGHVCNRQIAERVGRSPQWVRTIIHRFNAHGIAGVEWYPWMQNRGGPRKFLADVVEEMAAVALSPPKQLIGLTQWSLAKLREYLVQQQIIPWISLSWLAKLLNRCRVRWRRTKTWKESTDPQFRLKSQCIRRLYAHRPAGGRRICIDEFGPLNLQPRAGQCWAGGGKRVERLAANYHRRQGVRHFLAAYDLETDRLFGVFRPHKTGRDFLSFLRWLRRRYRAQETLHLVLDNYQTHLSRDVSHWASQHRIRFYFTPTNASWLNRIEPHFTALKKFALDNSHYDNHEQQQAAIQSYLDWYNRKRLLPIQSWSHYQSQRRAA